MTAVFLVANIAGSLIAVVAFIAFINGILSWFGGLIGLIGDVELSIELIFGYLFIPLAWVMGVEYEVSPFIPTRLDIEYEYQFYYFTIFFNYL